MDKSKKLEIVKQAITTYPNFPKEGVLFRDIFGVFQNVEAMKAMKDLIIEHISSLEVDVVVGLDARGFLFGPLISMQLEKPFVPIRKKGKLPGNVKQQSFALEYGEATCEIQTHSISKGNRVLIVDDLLGTGGSMKAAVTLLKELGAVVVKCLVIIELTKLQGRLKIDPIPIHSFIQYD